jgi:hypothetical protein
MKQINSGYNGNHKSIYIVPIGDIHLGNKYCDRDYLNRALKFVDKNKNRCRIFLMGDLLELATKTSVGRSVYDEAYPTQKQFEIAVETFKPYADLIDVIVEGNHEERIIRDTSFEITQEFAHRIGRFDAYGKFNAIVNTKVGDLIYSSYVWHGATGGTKESSAINALLGMREKAMTHLYFMGHTHKLMSLGREVYVPSINSEEPAKMKQLFVNTGSAVDEGGYADQRGLPYSKIGFGAVQLFAEERKMIFNYIDDLV